MSELNNKPETADEDWHFPIPRHHMYAICVLLTMSLLTAIFLPAPEEITKREQLHWSSTGRLPDSHQNLQSIIYADDQYATESIDSDPVDYNEILDGTDDNDAELAQGSSSSTTKPATPELSEEAPEWYEQTVVAGDTINNIFQNINQPYDIIRALENVPTYGKYIRKIKPGEKLYFMISEKNEVIALVKPLDKNTQINFYREDPNVIKFTARREPRDAHINENNVQNDNSSTVKELSESTVAQNTQQQATQDKEKQAKLDAEKKKQEALLAQKEKERLKEEAEKLKQQNMPQIAVRKELVSFEIKKGDTFINACINAGLSRSEAHSITNMYKGRLVARQLMPGDSVKVLFESAKPNSRIVAVAIKSKKLGQLNTFRNPSNGKFYDDAGTSTRTSDKFNRFPLMGNIKVTSNFNPTRRHPITGKVRPHNGTDFGVKVGTPVYAPADGVVVKATYQRAAGYYIVLQHKGAYSTVYMHLSKILVKPGDKIKANQKIALSGNTGASTGPHLHYELRINNRPVNAMKVNLPNGSSTVVTTSTDPKMKEQIAAYKRRLGIK